MTSTVAVVGAAGRMGQLMCRLVEAADDFELGARIGSAGELSEMLGADIVVDVTVPAASQAVVEFAIEHRINVVVGTSGWSNERIAKIGRLMALAPDVGVIIVPNFSLGSVLATSLSVTAARFFESIEIVESHHASKVDSPSGTAIRTAELMGAARDTLGPVAAPHVDQRARGQQVSSIPIHSLRLHGVEARQDVVFGGVGETLTISHETISPRSYEAGILLALRSARTAKGLVVGLDSLLELRSTGRATK